MKLGLAPLLLAVVTCMPAARRDVACSPEAAAALDEACAQVVITALEQACESGDGVTDCDAAQAALVICNEAIDKHAKGCR